MACWLCESKGRKEYMCRKGSCRICAAVAKIDDEINQAADILRHLLAKRCDLCSEQNRVHDPVHRLPVELQNHIFELLLPPRDEWGKISPRVEMPSYWASICRGWRDIVWSNPFLWSTLHIMPSGRTDFVHDWILRSRALPLTLHVQVVVPPWRELERPLALDVIGRSSSRLQSLSLEIPAAILRTFQDSNLQWHRLTRLQITLNDRITQPVPFLNPTASPEKIDLCNISFQSLRISWKSLSSAKVRLFDLQDLAQLFQHALQMTDCHILNAQFGPGILVMPPIIHRRMEKLRLGHTNRDIGTILLGFLTLPCLQELHTDDGALLVPISALVQRSSCPLTSLTLQGFLASTLEFLSHLQPFPGVTHLVLEVLRYDLTRVSDEEAAVLPKLLLEERYFPDLRHLTLRLEPFLMLWEMGLIPPLLDRKRLRPDGPNGRGLSKFLVVEQGQSSEFDHMWNSNVGEQLRALDSALIEDGFEFL